MEPHRDQLHVYAVGYEELTGERADVVEVLNLDLEGKSERDQIVQPLLDQVRTRIHAAGTALRANELPRLVSWCNACDVPETRPVGTLATFSVSDLSTRYLRGPPARRSTSCKTISKSPARKRSIGRSPSSARCLACSQMSMPSSV